VADARLEKLSKRFGETRAVQDLDLHVHDGEFFVLLGPSGAGKTTTLRLLAGLERPDAGRVLIGGLDMTAAPPAARDVSFVFQQYSLYPHLTVYDNLAFPLRAPAHRVPEPEIRERVEAVARMLHIDDKLANRATKLSGGQMQRVAIGRALVRRPNLYLMDEPLSSLDAKLRAEMRVELKRIQRELGATLLYVTHDQTEAMTMATRIGVLDHGRLVQIGSPREIWERPCNVHVATRLGSPGVNLVPRALFADVPLPGHVATLGLRTEHVAIRRDNGGRARVRRVEPLGDRNHLHLVLDDTALVVLADPDVVFDAGDAVTLELRDPLCFDAQGARVDLHA
jgi:multiple sugar transport system ATP-binding protein